METGVHVSRFCLSLFFKRLCVLIRDPIYITLHKWQVNLLSFYAGWLPHLSMREWIIFPLGRQWKNTNDSHILEAMMNQIDETWEQRMKPDLIDSLCATNHIIVSPVIRSSALVKFKQARPATPHAHRPLPLSALPPSAIKLRQCSSITPPAPDRPLAICEVITPLNAGHQTLTHASTNTAHFAFNP